MISQGAEAKIYLEDGIVVKERISKGYRHPIIDKQIRIRRTRQEGKILYKAKLFGVNVPAVLNLDKHNIPKDDFLLKMEYISGDKLSEKLNEYSKEKQHEVMKKLGKQVFILHLNDIIHGDLTTSNTILKDSEIFIIDFGLGFFSTKIEDRAVDLHLIKQALEAKHYMNFDELFNAFLEGYNSNDDKSGMRDKVLDQLRKVETRGRYKDKY